MQTRCSLEDAILKKSNDCRQHGPMRSIWRLNEHKRKLSRLWVARISLLRIAYTCFGKSNAHWNTATSPGTFGSDLVYYCIWFHGWLLQSLPSFYSLIPVVSCIHTLYGQYRQYMGLTLNHRELLGQSWDKGCVLRWVHTQRPCGWYSVLGTLRHVNLHSFHPIGFVELVHHASVQQVSRLFQLTRAAANIIHFVYDRK